MGCDIHVHGEVKINGKWEHWSQPYISRSYDLFAKMADVRNGGEIEPIAKPRGLPEDVSALTKFDCDEHYGIDGHSHSWLSGEEVESLCKWYDAKCNEWYPGKFNSFQHQQLGYVFGNGWNVEKYPDDYPDGVESARIVFWFDN